MDFVGKRYRFFLLSGLVVVPGPAPYWASESVIWVMPELENLRVVWLEDWHREAISRTSGGYVTG